MINISNNQIEMLSKHISEISQPIDLSMLCEREGDKLVISSNFDHLTITYTDNSKPLYYNEINFGNEEVGAAKREGFEIDVSKSIGFNVTYNKDKYRRINIDFEYYDRNIPARSEAEFYGIFRTGNYIHYPSRVDKILDRTALYNSLCKAFKTLDQKV